MKFITIILIGLFGAISQGMAQDRAIKFEEGNFQTALDLAKSTKKMIFLDAYTSWCGPCKQMEKEVFTQNEVADFFNTNFVNFGIDAEKGEGVNIKERYSIEVYPTFLLIDGQGNEIFRLVGGHNASQFIELMREGMDPENSMTALEQKFKAGERSYKFMDRYLRTLVRANKRELMEPVLENYFSEMPVKELCTPSNWTLYDTYVTDFNSPLYRRIIEQAAEFKTCLGDSLIEEKLSQAYNIELFSYIINPKNITSEQCQTVESDLRKIHFSQDNEMKIRIYLDIARYKMEKKYAEVLAMCDAGIPSFTESQWCSLAMGLGFFKDAPLSERKRAFEIVKREFLKEKERGEKGNPNVLHFLNTVATAIVGNDAK